MENEDPFYTFEYGPALPTNNPAAIQPGVQIARWNFNKPSGPKRVRKKADQAKPSKPKPYERHASILDASGLQQQSVGVPGPSSHSHASGSTLPSHSTAMAPPDPPGTGLRSFGSDEMVLDDISQSVGAMSTHSSFSTSDALISPVAKMNIISHSTPAPSQAPSRSPSVTRSQKPSKLSVVESVVDILKDAGLTTTQMLLLILETPANAESKKLTNFRNKLRKASAAFS
ncbi:hypothetical protein D9611_014708 [Ephemerocybe angulata]|uniref:Uncharacterized protein n=1 Tax=Ephemerocybe angulata TaxID=980116 RepID=A0A8H5ARK5_9AGAR|nr:hypothetical protein D9611_014708 [Tulosesus angulatus]